MRSGSPPVCVSIVVIFWYADEGSQFQDLGNRFVARGSVAILILVKVLKQWF
jgi:hypothetical protein